MLQKLQQKNLAQQIPLAQALKYTICQILRQALSSKF